MFMVNKNYQSHSRKNDVCRKLLQSEAGESW